MARKTVFLKGLELLCYVNYFTVFLAVRGKQINFYSLFVTGTYELIELI